MSTTQHVAGVITFNEWNLFTKEYGEIGYPDMMIGNGTAISAWEAMSAGHNFNREGFGRPSGTSLNGDPLALTRVWLNDVSTITNLNNTSLIVWPKSLVLYGYMLANWEQDETARDAAQRITQRYFSVSSAYVVRYENFIRRATF